MTDINKIERFASLKFQIKEMEKEAKELQTELIAENAGTKLVTDFGTLVLSTRTNYEKIDNEEFISKLSQEEFNAVATVTPGTIKRELGSVRFEMLLATDLINEKSKTQYYSLRK